MSKRLLTMVTAMLLSLFSCLNLWADNSGEIIAQGATRNIRWILTDDGTLTLDGTGQMIDYGQSGIDAPWMTYNERITKLVMTGSITNVSRMAFNECSNLEDVILPSTIKSIDDYAFNNCSSLKKFTFPAALETIGLRAFYNCRIENLELPDGLKTLGESAFTSNSFSKLYIPKSVTYINENCFDNTKQLESIEVDKDNKIYTSKDENGNNCEAIIKKSTSDTDDVTLIQGCRNTVIGNNVTVIGAYAFYEQPLSEIHIPNSVKKIDTGAFQGCTNLRVLEIGEGLQYIGSGAFYFCHVDSVTISTATPPTYGASAFGPNEYIANATLYVPSYAMASQYRDNEAWSKAFPTIKTSEKRLYAELDQDNWTLKFHYDDKTDFADGIAILDNLRFNFSSQDVESLLNEYVTLDPTEDNDDARNYIKEIDFDPSFRNYKPTSCYHLFYHFMHVTKISHLEYLNTEDVIDMSYMFAACFNLESLDLSSFNTSKVKDFGNMFSQCQTLQNLDLTPFNTENATNMEYMFFHCFGLESIDLSSFNTSKVTNFRRMFLLVNHKQADKCNIYVSDKFYIADEANGDEMFYWEYNPHEGKAEGKEYANYITGYFQKKVGTVGNCPIGAKGENLTVSQLTLTDGNDYVLTENAPVTATAATYSREMTSKWGTLCLPYTITYDADSDYSFYGIEDINNDVVTLREITYDIEAGTPVLFCRKDNATSYTATITGSGKLMYSGRSINRLFGTFCSMVLESKVLGYDQYFIAKDQFRRVGNDKVKLGAYRASLRPYLTTEAASTLRIAANGEATDINAAEVLNGVNDGTAEYYNINGVRIDGLQKGMNIVKIGGKTRKVLVK